MKFLVYLMTLILFSTAVAQSPTIVQGSYISNVFGNSNFIKNPNAQSGLTSVTVSSAAVVRSLTTPLMAASEFTITTSSTTGFADWEARAFDVGMKYQICEARFTYRGFSTGTTTAQVISGASTVIASQVLIPSTDPRVVSIVFNCGDLSQTTKLRLQQATANLTGANEIGGIYMGLATNMANVAQAELAGATEYGGCSGQFSVTSTSFAPQSTVASCTLNNFGSATTITKDLSITIPNAKPGFYQIHANILPYSVAVGNGCYWSIKEDTSGYLSGSTFASPSTGFGAAPLGASQLSASYNNTTTSTRTWRVVARSSSGACQIDPTVASLIISVYRFPTASEQVLTPNITSSWGAVVHTSGNQTLHSGSAEPTTFSSFNSATWNQPSRLKGKAAVTTTNSGNDLGFSVPNLPVGNYEMKISGAINTVTGGSGFTSICNFRVRETTTDSTVIAYQHNGESTPGTGTRDYVTSGVGMFTNNSVATRNFIVEASKFHDTTATNNSGCEIFTSSSPTGASYNTYISFTIQPLDYQLPLPVFIDQTPYTVTAISLTAPVAPYGRFEASGAGTTITLFGCSATTKGYNVEVKRIDASNNITVSRSGSDTIDGATTDLLAVNFQATQYVCNGSGGWRRF